MSAVTICADVTTSTSVRWPATRTVLPCQCGVCALLKSPRRRHIPAHMVTLRHGRQLGDLPNIGMSRAGRHATVSFVRSAGAVVVVRALGILLIQHAVRMHAVGMRAVVLEDNLDRVAHGPA